MVFNLVTATIYHEGQTVLLSLLATVEGASDEVLQEAVDNGRDPVIRRLCRTELWARKDPDYETVDKIKREGE